MFGHDAVLLDTRRCLLQSAGWDAVTVSTVAAVKSALMERQWRLLLVCHTVSETENRTVKSLVAVYAPEVPVLTLQAGFPARTVSSGECMTVLSGPKHLLTTVQTLLHTP